MSEILDSLLDLLDLESIEVNMFRGHSPEEGRGRVFGGQVAAQALMAAGRTVDPSRNVHSLHAYFLRPGDPAIPILYQVDRIRDGKSFTTRRVVAIQHGEAIFNLSAQFHLTEPGLEHGRTMPEVPGPEGLPDWATRIAAQMEKTSGQIPEWFKRPRPIDMRYVDDPGPRGFRDPRPDAVKYVWMRANGTLPDDDQLLHSCVLAYASDMSLLDSITLPHDISWEDGLMMASLDHCMWFHRPFRADEWLLYDQESPAAAGARGLAQGRLFTQDGTLVVSVMQEGLFRMVNTKR
ncbi:MAG TPA: acyl-CoA thioesterase II [Acidimicrobiales bacterium]|nr:acyl-CoA thioesterase II [Acidimicrobiales bacterium]